MYIKKTPLNCKQNCIHSPCFPCVRPIVPMPENFSVLFNDTGADSQMLPRYNIRPCRDTRCPGCPTPCPTDKIDHRGVVGSNLCGWGQPLVVSPIVFKKGPPVSFHPALGRDLGNQQAAEPENNGQTTIDMLTNPYPGQRPIMNNVSTAPEPFKNGVEHFNSYDCMECTGMPPLRSNVQVSNPVKMMDFDPPFCTYRTNGSMTCFDPKLKQ